MQAKALRDLEANLWKAADQLRANSKLTATEYSMPVLGLIFLRHAYNRYVNAKSEIDASLPVHPERGKRQVIKSDFLAKSAMYLPEKAQFDYLVNLKEDEDAGEAINNAMKEIETEHENLSDVLPKNYNKFSNELLRELLRIFNSETLQRAEGDIFGKIYEYFLNEFAKTGAQEGGEFFTPFSLVNTIVNVIEPDHGVVLDPAVGSAGMFVQTGYFIESEGFNPAEKVTFYGQEKTETNTKLAKMNMAVHGLEGSILEGNTFYEDKHDLVGACDFVMANPPFNVDGVDKNRDWVKNDSRLPFGLPKNDNANYLWIQYFYSYLKPTGRAGFVMASSASDAGHSEKELRKKLVETGAVDVMLAIGNNFFYTRSLPCTLWFFDRAKENDPLRKDKILMLDARKIFHKVTQKINDFSPEQLRNLICIVDLYRGKSHKLELTLDDYYERCEQIILGIGCTSEDLIKAKNALLPAVVEFCSNHLLDSIMSGYAELLNNIITDPVWEHLKHLSDNCVVCQDRNKIKELSSEAVSVKGDLEKVVTQVKDLYPSLRKHARKMRYYYETLQDNDYAYSDFIKYSKYLLGDSIQAEVSDTLDLLSYYWHQIKWLRDRFPDNEYQDVSGLCSLVSREDVAAKDYSLSPGRYVGVDTSTDEDIDYEERLKEIHIELKDLNEEAVQFYQTIMENYSDLTL